MRDLAPANETDAMIEISPTQVAPAVASMFHPGMPTGIRPLAVLAGGNNGRIHAKAIFLNKPPFTPISASSVCAPEASGKWIEMGRRARAVPQ